MRVDRYAVTANGVTKSRSASWWSIFGFAKEQVSGETYFVSNFVSCQKCFATYRYGSSSTESISRHQCTGSISSSAKSTTADNQLSLGKHFIKEKKTISPF